MPTLQCVLADKATRWRRLVVPGWYGEGDRTIEVCPGACVWYHTGLPAVPIRWVLIRDPEERFRPQALLGTDPTQEPLTIIGWFVQRWQIEVTFEESRARLGVESQRQWSDELRHELAEAERQLGERDRTIADLERQLAAVRRTSATSSKPPSADGLRAPQAPSPAAATDRASVGRPAGPCRPPPSAGAAGARRCGRTALAGRLPRRVVAEVLETVLGVELGLGSVQALVAETSAALAALVSELERQLPREPVLNVDETGWPNNGERRWLWALVAAHFVLYVVARTRTAAVLVLVLGATFAGILARDRYGAYLKYHQGRAQFCWAHLKRDFLGLQQLARTTAADRFARDALALLARLFRLWHKHKDGRMTRSDLLVRSIPIQWGLLALAARHLEATEAEVRTMARALFRHADRLFVFLEHEGVEPTNNAAERALRIAVQWHKTSFGNRSKGGTVATARLLTAAPTCRVQRRNALDYLTGSRALPPLAPSRALTPASSSPGRLNCYVAAMFREAQRYGDKRHPHPPWTTWTKVKFDRHIIGIVKAMGVRTIYSDNGDVQTLARSFGIQVFGWADLPLPEPEPVPQQEVEAEAASSSKRPVQTSLFDGLTAGPDDPGQALSDILTVPAATSETNTREEQTSTLPTAPAQCSTLLRVVETFSKKSVARAETPASEDEVAAEKQGVLTNSALAVVAAKRPETE